MAETCHAGLAMVKHKFSFVIVFTESER